jgi:hypothetical protein
VGDAALKALRGELTTGQSLLEARITATEAAAQRALSAARDVGGGHSGLGARIAALEAAAEAWESKLREAAQARRGSAEEADDGAEQLPGWPGQLRAARTAVESVVVQESRFGVELGLTAAGGTAEDAAGGVASTEAVCGAAGSFPAEARQPDSGAAGEAEAEAADAYNGPPEGDVSPKRDRAPKSPAKRSPTKAPAAVLSETPRHAPGRGGRTAASPSPSSNALSAARLRPSAIPRAPLETPSPTAAPAAAPATARTTPRPAAGRGAVGTRKAWVSDGRGGIAASPPRPRRELSPAEVRGLLDTLHCLGVTG